MVTDTQARASAKTILDARLASAPPHVLPSPADQALSPVALRDRVLSKLEWPESARLHALVALEAAHTSAPSSQGKPWSSRFAHSLVLHYVSSASDPALPPSEKAALFSAAATIQRSLDHMAGAMGSEKRLDALDVPQEEIDWLMALGLSKTQFLLNINTFAHYHRKALKRPAQSSSSVILAPSLSQEARVPTRSLDEALEAMASSAFNASSPSWLILGPPRNDMSNRTRAWGLSAIDSVIPPTQALGQALDGAWQLFAAGNVVEADRTLAPIYTSHGVTWSPPQSADGHLLWTWIRLVRHGAQAYDSSDPHRRVAAVSAVELLSRLGFEVDVGDYVEHLVDAAMSDLRPTTQPPLSRVFAVYSARLVAALGHEEFFRSVAYDNADRARTRAAWAQELPDGTLTVGSTSSEWASAIQSIYRQFRHLVSEQTDNYRLSDRYLHLLSESRSIFDDSEWEIVNEALPILADVLMSTGPDYLKVNVKDLREFGEHATSLQRDVADCGSVLVQETLGPALFDAHDLVALSLANASRTSQPVIVAEVITARLPLRSRVSTSFKVRWLVRNTGNSTAKYVRAFASSQSLRFLEPDARVNELAPASETELAFSAACDEQRSTADLQLSLSWVDDLSQDFEGSWTAVVEDQADSHWSDLDANPYSLSTIADPLRLVGRTQEWAALEGVLRMSDSVYITGLKRVGKSSLVRTLLTSLQAEQDWSVSRLELGTMLGGGESASSVALGLLDGIEEALSDLDVDVRPLDLDEMARDGYARYAGRWLRGIDRVLASEQLYRVVVAVDDFDGLPNDLVEGEQGQAFFLFLRSLVDRPWLSLVFVGSEVMPTIISAQSHHLNQVRRTAVDHFESSADTAVLLRKPSEAQLEWADTSVEMVHRFANGNPYYATMIAQRLWDTLRSLDRTQVEVHDVLDAVNHIARTADDAHFSHMWSDDPTGVAPKARRAMLSAALILALARCAGLFESADLEEVVDVAQQIAPEATADELKTVLRRLVGRGIVAGDSSSPSVSLRVPLLSEWLRHRGRHELGNAFEAFAKDRTQKRLVTSRDLVDVVDGLSYAGKALSEHRLHAWLEQFGDDARDRQLAFLLVRRLAKEGYFNGERLYRVVLPRLVDDILTAVPEIQRGRQKYLRNVIIVEHGRSGSSGPGVVTQLRQIAHVKKESCVTIAEVPRLVNATPQSVIWVIDDFAGTGAQLAGVVDDLVLQLGRLGDWQERVILVVGAAVAARTDSWSSARFGDADLRVVAGHRVSNRLRAFHPEAAIFESEDDRRRAEDLVTVVGKQLSPQRPLGWANEGLLVLLEGNCPNNTLPVLWKGGRYAGHDWLPLFPRAV